MNAARTHLALFAKLLVILVLINGLICAVGHGQMLSSLFEPSPTETRHGHGLHGMAGMGDMHHAGSDQTLPMPGMNSPFGDCFFAGSLPLALLVFAVLGWLLRQRARRPIARYAGHAALPRALLPNLHPRAP